jgi:hypothetical protein
MLLSACPEMSVGLALPAPISDRLDELVRLAEQAGNRTNRKELMASLILAAPIGGEQVSELVSVFRRAIARDARLDGHANDATVPIRSHGPGPRPRNRR